MDFKSNNQNVIVLLQKCPNKRLSFFCKCFPFDCFNLLLCSKVLWYPGVWKVLLVVGPSPSVVMACTSSLYKLAGCRPDTTRTLPSWKRGDSKSRRRTRQSVKHSCCVKVQESCRLNQVSAEGPWDLPAEEINFEFAFKLRQILYED